MSSNFDPFYFSLNFMLIISFFVLQFQFHFVSLFVQFLDIKLIWPLFQISILIINCLVVFLSFFLMFLMIFLYLICFNHPNTFNCFQFADENQFNLQYRLTSEFFNLNFPCCLIFHLSLVPGILKISISPVKLFSNLLILLLLLLFMIILLLLLLLFFLIFYFDQLRFPLIYGLLLWYLRRFLLR